MTSTGQYARSHRAGTVEERQRRGTDGDTPHERRRRATDDRRYALGCSESSGVTMLIAVNGSRSWASRSREECLAVIEVGEEGAAGEQWAKGIRL